ncbi:single-stranded-DNA-specific exonuclease RecJ [Candidatus Njordibacter sp. Uisw_002]|uniref:single-stranded-DNA-specific exonuclease RecJ n=1 Tax=Candidatus Njordibacter sp. Uisw_002 TaxID=3230971 RepID=UPI003D44B506
MSVRLRLGTSNAALDAAFDPLVARVLAHRGINDPAQVDYQLKKLLPYHQLKGIDTAVTLLVQALEAQANILIVGDFDCDGATSTSLALLALGAMGAKNVSYLVPNRFDFGYGLSTALVDYAKAIEPDLIVTVDNGIASHEGVARAHELGIKVVVTDHHLAAETLPDADAIVNPNQPGCEFPFKSTAGVGVIFYVMSALRRQLQTQGWFDQQRIKAPNMAQYLDLVALGTVADLVPMEHNNRILVAQGVARIRAGKARPGILALLAVAKRQHYNLQATDLGFSIGPRLNAAGRLEDMSLGIECLLSDDEHIAAQLAHELDELNAQRRHIEADMQQQAGNILTRLESSQDQELPKCVCLFHPDWHQGVVGIVASRIKEKWHRPALVFAMGDADTLKGSCRSIAGFHLRDALAAVDAHNPGLIIKFGGHAMAAGLSIKADKFEAFKEALDTYAQEHLPDSLLAKEWRSDGQLSAQELQLNQAFLLQQAGPWGQGFEEPTFHGRFVLVQQRIVGEKHLKLVLADLQTGELVDAIYFNIDLAVWPSTCEQADLVYRLDINEFRGRQSLQLMVQHMTPVA